MVAHLWQMSDDFQHGWVAHLLYSWRLRKDYVVSILALFCVILSVLIDRKVQDCYGLTSAMLVIDFFKFFLLHADF